MKKRISIRLLIFMLMIAMTATYIPAYGTSDELGEGGADAPTETIAEEKEETEKANSEASEKEEAAVEEGAAKKEGEEAASGADTSSKQEEVSNKADAAVKKSAKKAAATQTAKESKDPIPDDSRFNGKEIDDIPGPRRMLKATPPKFADGVIVDYTFDTGSYTRFKVDGGGGLSRGWCIEPGIPAGGTKAKITKIGNNTLRAKVAYYYGEKKGYNTKTVADDGYYNDANMSYRMAFSIMIQYAVGGQTALNTLEAAGVSKYSLNMVKADVDKLKSNGSISVTVPPEFEAYEAIPTNGTGTVQPFMFWLIRDTGYMYLMKSVQSTDSSESFLSIAPANYAVGGAVYGVYTDISCDEAYRATDMDGNAVTLTTYSNGLTNTVRVLAGTYYAKELVAPKGCKPYVPPTIWQTPTVTVTSSNTASSPAIFTATEPVAAAFPEFKLQKVKNEDPSYDYQKLLGAEYTLNYYNVDPFTPDVSGLTPVRSWTFRTVEKTDGGIKYAGIDLATDTPIAGGALWTIGGNRVLPIGVFTLQETKAPLGLARREEAYIGRIWQPGSGLDAILTFDGKDNLNVKYPLIEPEQNAIIKIKKKDSDTKSSTPAGSGRTYSKASLAGAKYDVYYDDKGTLVKVGTIVTDDQGEGELKQDLNGKKLPLGKYHIKEVSPSPGYAVEAFYYAENPDPEFINGEHVINVETDYTTVDYSTYVVESLEPDTEAEITKTDIKTGKELPGAVLQVLNDKKEIVEEWTSADTPHIIKGLPDGKYTLHEVSAPDGYDLAEDVEFEIKADKVTHKVNMDNGPVDIKTTAKDVDTGTHLGYFSSEERIIDTVQYTHLIAGREYTFTGTLMDKATGAPLLDASGNPVTAEKKYTPPGKPGELTSGSVEMEFIIDASAFEASKKIVAFETVEYKGRQLAVHADLNDDEQTIHYADIKTKALDKKSKSHNLVAGEKAVIIDTVKYKGLVPGDKYTLTGQLYDATDDKMLAVTASKDFTAKAENGEVDVSFKFDASKLGNHTVVVYEQLHPYGRPDIVLCRHEDPDDAKQTIYIKKLGLITIDDKDRFFGSPNMGDSAYVLGFASLLIAATAALAVVIRRRVKSAAADAEKDE